MGSTAEDGAFGSLKTTVDHYLHSLGGRGGVRDKKRQSETSSAWEDEIDEKAGNGSFSKVVRSSSAFDTIDHFVDQIPPANGKDGVFAYLHSLGGRGGVRDKKRQSETTPAWNDEIDEKAGNGSFSKVVRSSSAFDTIDHFVDQMPPTNDNGVSFQQFYNRSSYGDRHKGHNDELNKNTRRRSRRVGRLSIAAIVLLGIVLALIIVVVPAVKIVNKGPSGGGTATPRDPPLIITPTNASDSSTAGPSTHNNPAEMDDPRAPHHQSADTDVDATDDPRAPHHHSDDTDIDITDDHRVPHHIADDIDANDQHQDHQALIHAEDSRIKHHAPQDAAVESGNVGGGTLVAIGGDERPLKPPAVSDNSTYTSNVADEAIGIDTEEAEEEKDDEEEVAAAVLDEEEAPTTTAFGPAEQFACEQPLPAEFLTRTSLDVPDLPTVRQGRPGKRVKMMPFAVHKYAEQREKDHPDNLPYKLPFDLPYQLFLPKSYSYGGTKKYPVVIYLHGSNDGHFPVMNSQSLPRLLSTDQSTVFDPRTCWCLDPQFEAVAAWREAPQNSTAPFLDQVENLRSPLADCDFANTFPGIVIMPQGWRLQDPTARKFWELRMLHAVELLTSHIIKRYRGDPERVVLTGHSGGGSGAASFASIQPKLFSAVNVIGDPWADFSSRRLDSTPVWIVGDTSDGQGGNDKSVSNLKRRRMERDSSKIRYTRYVKAPSPPDPKYRGMVGRASYDLIYRDSRLWDWAFGQRNLNGKREWTAGLG